MQNTIGLIGFLVFVTGLALYDYRMGLVVGGGLALVAAITGMMINAYRTAGPRE